MRVIKASNSQRWKSRGRKQCIASSKDASLSLQYSLNNGISITELQGIIPTVAEQRRRFENGFNQKVGKHAVAKHRLTLESSGQTLRGDGVK